MGGNPSCCARACGAPTNVGPPPPTEYEPQREAEVFKEYKETRPAASAAAAPLEAPTVALESNYGAENVSNCGKDYVDMVARSKEGPLIQSPEKPPEKDPLASAAGATPGGEAKDEEVEQKRKPEGGFGAEFDGDEYTIMLDKTSGAGLGIDVHFVGECLRVDDITGGLFGEWNTSHPDLQVKVGDFIVEANRARGHAGRLVWECRRNQMLELKLRRPSPLEVDSNNRK